MHDELLRAVPECFRPRIGIGTNKFLAFVAARVRRSSGVTKISGDAAEFLAPHPIDLLPCPSELKEDLHLLGLDAMGDVARQEMGALQDRFG